MIVKVDGDRVIHLNSDTDSKEAAHTKRTAKKKIEKILYPLSVQKVTDVLPLLSTAYESLGISFSPMAENSLLIHAPLENLGELLRVLEIIDNDKVVVKATQEAPKAPSRD